MGKTQHRALSGSTREGGDSKRLGRGKNSNCSLCSDRVLGLLEHKKHLDLNRFAMGIGSLYAESIRSLSSLYWILEARRINSTKNQKLLLVYYYRHDNDDTTATTTITAPASAKRLFGFRLRHATDLVRSNHLCKRECHHNDAQ